MRDTASSILGISITALQSSICGRAHMQVTIFVCWVVRGYLLSRSFLFRPFFDQLL